MFAHQVPLLTVALSSLQTPISSDLTLNRLLPYINGVNSIARIARLADTDLSLTRRAIQHLIYYGCLVLLDVFSFGAIYAPTAEISGFVVDDQVKEECRRYVQVPRLRIGSDSKTIRVSSDSGTSRDDDSSASSASQRSDSADSTLRSNTEESRHNGSEYDDERWHIEDETLIILYTSLRQGLTLKNWVLNNFDSLRGIDVRRLITFAVIKGFLYRVHKYSLATSSPLPPAPPTSLQTSAATSIANVRDSETATIRNVPGHHPSQPNIHVAQMNPSFALHRPSIASTTSLDPGFGKSAPQSKQGNAQGDSDNMMNYQGHENGLPLLRFLDGMHCFDEICTDLELPERQVEAKIRGLGDGLGIVLHR